MLRSLSLNESHGAAPSSRNPRSTNQRHEVQKRLKRGPCENWKSIILATMASTTPITINASVIETREGDSSHFATHISERAESACGQSER